MTAAEFLSAHAARDDTAGFDRATGIAFFGLNGLDVSAIPEKVRTGNRYRKGVPELPRTYRRMIHGDTLAIGGHDWRVICVHGHAPEHAALFCPSLGVLISGDQVLPRITTNVGVWGNQPEANPLRLYLDSFARFADIPGSVRVLPSHDRVFEGLHPRIIQLARAPRRAAGEAAGRVRSPGDRVRGAARAVPAQARRAPDRLRHGRGDRAPALPRGGGQGDESGRGWLEALRSRLTRAGWRWEGFGRAHAPSSTLSMRPRPIGSRLVHRPIFSTPGQPSRTPPTSSLPAPTRPYPPSPQRLYTERPPVPRGASPRTSGDAEPAAGRSREPQVMADTRHPAAGSSLPEARDDAPRGTTGRSVQKSRWRRSRRGRHEPPAGVAGGFGGLPRCGEDRRCTRREPIGRGRIDSLELGA